MADPSTEINVDLDIQEVLLAASQHDIPKLRRLIRDYEQVGNPANVKDPETGYTPLHAAIAACEPIDNGNGDGDGEDADARGASNGVGANGDAGAQKGRSTANAQEESGLETVRTLLEEGAIWNDLDLNNETPGCLARRLGLKDLYEAVVDAGVRAELLLNRLDGYEALSEEDDDEEEEEEGEGQEDQEEKEEEEEQQQQPDQNEVTVAVPEDQVQELIAAATASGAEVAEAAPDVTNTRYLNSDLSFQNGRLLDQDQNGVMMAWETDIMSRSAKKLLPTPGLRVLNIGHGMGIVDNFFQELSPSTHHIIEAHPAVVEEMKRKGWHEKPGVKIHEGRWQDVLPALVLENETFDAIYYDTFAESYQDFRDFFTEQLIGLLEQDGRWGFFNGMGADRQISYDVYQKVVDMDLFEAGFEAEWEGIAVPKLEGEWTGVRRPYWNVDEYRLPLCSYMG